jgi:hypothetical protein
MQGKRLLSKMINLLLLGMHVALQRIDQPDHPWITSE